MSEHNLDSVVRKLSEVFLELALWRDTREVQSTDEDEVMLSHEDIISMLEDQLAA